MELIASFIFGNITAYTEELYQYDKDVDLILYGAGLAEEFDVHFSNSKDEGTATVVHVIDSDTVRIPDAMMESGEYVYAFVVIDGATAFTVIIPVIPRPGVPAAS